MSKPIISGGEENTLLSKPLRETTSDQLSAMFLQASKAPYDWLIGLE